jgi:hypothetical protein
LKSAHVRIILLVLLTLFVGVALGYVVGRRRLEQEWQNPLTQVDRQAVDAIATYADAAPALGTTVLKPLPLRRARQALKPFVANDMLTVSLVSFGNGSQGSELHLVIDSRAACNVVALRGVAYGYSATGIAQAVNNSNAHFVQFEAKGITLEAGGHEVVTQPLHYTSISSIGIAHVDYYQCDDGSSWKRPT